MQLASMSKSFVCESILVLFAERAMSHKYKSRSEEPVSNTDVTDDFDGCRRREARWNDLVKHSQEVTYAKGQLDNKNDVMSRYVYAKITKRNYTD